MTRIRILLAALPALLRDILSDAVAGEPDMEIVGTVASGADLDSLARKLLPDVIVLGTAAESAASSLRSVQPPIIVLAIATKGDRATLFAPHREPIELIDVSTSSILGAIRDHTAVKGSTRLPPA